MDQSGLDLAKTDLVAVLGWWTYVLGGVFGGVECPGGVWCCVEDLAASLRKQVGCHVGLRYIFLW